MKTKLALVLILAARLAAAQSANPLTVELNADSTRADGPNGVIEFSGVTIRQGDLSVRADLARSSGLDFENSAWTFTGDVEFRTADTRIAASQAVLRFAGQQLTDVTLEGNPLSFEQERTAATRLLSNDGRLEFQNGSLARAFFRGQPVEFFQSNGEAETRSRANNMIYDALDGVLTLQDNAWIGEGGREISGNSIQYDIIGQKIVAASDASGQERVVIRITPPAAEDGSQDEPESDPSPQ